MQFEVKMDTKQLLRSLKNYQTDQVPFATAVALNQTATEVKKELVAEMKKVFDNPTPQTLNSLFIKNATKHNLSATVKIKDFFGKGTPASIYLSAQIEGGGRAQKKSERRLAELGLPAYFVPGQGMKLNKYGNIPASQLVKILSGLKAFNDAGYDANRTSNSKKKNKTLAEYFVITKRGRLLPGVYQRLKNTIKPLLIFIYKPNYNKRFDFARVGIATANKHFANFFYKALANARPK